MRVSGFAELDEIIEANTGAAIEVQRAPCPGLLESAYLECAVFGLVQHGHKSLEPISRMLCHFPEGRSPSQSAPEAKRKGREGAGRRRGHRDSVRERF